MNILVLTSTFPDKQNSYTGTFVPKMAEYMYQQGHNVTVLTQRRLDFPLEEKLPFMTLRRFEFFGWQSNIVFGNQGSIPVRMTLSYLSNMFKTARSIIQEQSIEIIHCFWLIPSGFIGVLLKYLTDIPVVTTAAGSDLEIWVDRQVPRIFISHTARYSDRLIVLGSNMGRTASGLGCVPEKITTLLSNGGTDIGRFRPSVNRIECRQELGLEPTDFVCLFVGRLEPPKRIPLLLEAIALARVKVSNIKMVLVGAGEFNSCQTLVEQLGNTLLVCGPKEHQQLELYFKSSDIFVYASDHEGIPTAIVEALACGLPVVASRVGGIPDVVIDGEHGYLVDNQPELFADRIIRLALDSGHRNQMGIVARRFATDYLSEAEILALVEGIYCDLGAVR